MSEVKVEWREKDNKERTEKGDGREEGRGGDISINRKQQAAKGATVGRNGWLCD